MPELGCSLKRLCSARDLFAENENKQFNENPIQS